MAELAQPAAPGRLTGVALMVTSGLSNQVGASAGALAFPVIGPLGVVAVRQWVAATVLWATARPEPRAFTRAQWRPVLALALVYAVMNLTLYTAIDRVGLGLAVTLEFLGPLTVALASSRRRLDAACAVIAAAAVLVLIHPAPSTDYLGIGVGLLAAVCWGCYILLNRTLGQRLPGLQGTAAASLVSSSLRCTPIGPASAKPPGRISRFLMPRSAASLTASRMASGRMTMTARSTGGSMAPIEVTDS